MFILLSMWSLRKRTFLEKPIDVIGELPTDGLVAMIDCKRQSFVKDDEISIFVKDFRELILNVLREVFQDCKVIAVVVALTAGGECGDDGVVRPNDPPGAGRVRPGLASVFPLRERCEKVGNICRVSVVERQNEMDTPASWDSPVNLEIVSYPKKKGRALMSHRSKREGSGA